MKGLISTAVERGCLHNRLLYSANEVIWDRTKLSQDDGRAFYQFYDDFVSLSPSWTREDRSEQSSQKILCCLVHVPKKRLFTKPSCHPNKRRKCSLIVLEEWLIGIFSSTSFLSRNGWADYRPLSSPSSSFQLWTQIKSETSPPLPFTIMFTWR